MSAGRRMFRSILWWVMWTPLYVLCLAAVPVLMLVNLLRGVSPRYVFQDAGAGLRIITKAFSPAFLFKD